MILLAIGLALILAAGIAAVVLRRSPTAEPVHDWLVVGGSVIAAIPAVDVLTGGSRVSVTIPASTPGGAWVFGLDALSAVFLLAILVVGAAAAVFGTRYVRAEAAHRATWLGQAELAVLLVAMALVVLARAVVPFLICWEAMAVVSYFTLVADHARAEVRRAGLLYLVATHTGTLALFVMFATWVQPSTSWTFAALAEAAPRLPHGGAAVLLLALVGFGFKAGLVPLHFWLPSAHSAAPTPVSALLSGVVIKLGIYGIVRVLALLGVVPAWWGWLVLGIGAASGVLGVLWALAQHDIKRLLAYHSVENIGIILMGIGVGALGTAYRLPAVALLGYAGAVLHTLNHAFFKGLLFLGAGAVHRATGTRDLEELGGLARRMPLTWLGFAIGSAAIIGVPPLNGFVSEWLVYQALFRTGAASSVARLAVFGIPVLALIGGLALACFTKVAGAVFLGVPRSEHAARAREVAAGMTSAMLALAAGCIALGVVPALGVWPAVRAAAELSGGDAAGAAALALGGASALSLVALGTIVLVGVVWLVRHGPARPATVRIGPTWGCGYSAPTARMQYTASSFAAPLLSVFGRLSGVRVERTPGALRTVPHDPVLDRAALPLWGVVHRAAVRLRPIQQGRLHFYVLYVLAAVVVLLAYLALGAR